MAPNPDPEGFEDWIQLGGQRRQSRIEKDLVAWVQLIPTEKE